MTDASRRERRRPFELVGLSAVLGVFVGGVVLMATREPLLALTWAGAAFIVALVAVAMLALVASPAASPAASPPASRPDDEDPDPPAH